MRDRSRKLYNGSAVVDECYEWIDSKLVELASKGSSKGVFTRYSSSPIVRTELLPMLNGIFITLPVAISKLEFEVRAINNRNKVYKWKFAVVAQTREDGIRRADDIAEILFIEVPDEIECPPSPGVIGLNGSAAKSNSDLLFVSIDPHKIDWRV